MPGSMVLRPHARLNAFAPSCVIRRPCIALYRFRQPLLSGRSNKRRNLASGFLGGPQPGMPGQPGQDDQGLGNTAEERDSKIRNGSTIFKMFESAATTFASLVILALAGYGYHRYYKHLVLQKMENAFKPGDPVLELAALSSQVPSNTMEEEVDHWIPRKEQVKIDAIVDGTERGHYHLLIGEKGTGKSSMLLDAMQKVNGEGISMFEAHADLEIFRIRLGKALDFEFYEDYIGSLFSIRGPRDTTALLDIERAFNKLEKTALKRRSKAGKPLVLIINSTHLLRDDEDGRDLLELMQQRAEQWAASNLVTIVFNSDDYWVYERLKQYATRMEVLPVLDLDKEQALGALRQYRSRYYKEEPSQDILEQVYDRIGGRLTFLSRIAKSPDMVHACDKICRVEKTWFLNKCWILGEEMDDDVMDEQKYSSAAMVLAKALVDKEKAMKSTYDPEKGHILPQIPLHEARQIMTRADFIKSYDHINIFTIDSNAMVRADSVPMQNAFREICNGEGFEEHLEKTLDRISAIESLGRTRELVAKDLWDRKKYNIKVHNAKGGVDKTVVIESTQPQQDLSRDSQHGPEESKDSTSAAKAAEGEQVADGSSTPPAGVFQATVKLPHEPHHIQIMVSTQEQVQDLRQSIVELPETFQYSCFHLEHNGVRINDFIELSEVSGLSSGSELTLIEDPYTEKEARMHLVRVRELIGAAGDRIDTLHGISAGVSLHDTVVSLDGLEGSVVANGKPSNGATPHHSHPLVDYDFEAPGSVKALIPPTQSPAPKTIKTISLSSWNPPPHYLRQKGHLMYLQVTTNEGEQHQITCNVSGFFVNKCSNSKFDPFPRAPPKNHHAHSLLALIEDLSPSFKSSFTALQNYNNKKDPLAIFQLTNAIPSNPWLVPSPTTLAASHQPDSTRAQENYLLSGTENVETLRDWNEEFQSTRELPRETVQDRVFRERLTSKLFADYNEAAARGAVLVARGEVAPLNPTEGKDAQIFVYNNIFFSFGADGVGTFTTEGGDEAARVAVGKDVMGVKAVNQLDIQGLHTPGTIVIDYLGKRLVGQSIVPGIFKQREPCENQIDYGGVEGRDTVAENEAFVPVFQKLSKAMRVKKHPVWDKDEKRHDLEGSVETKGLLGTDGRKYVLDLYRLTPLDVSWLEEHGSEALEEDVEKKAKAYPHRMTVLRPELIEAYWRFRMGNYVKEEVERRRKAPNTTDSITHQMDAESQQVKADRHKDPEKAEESRVEKGGEVKEAPTDQERVDISGFQLAFNPDVFCGQIPQTAEEKEDWAKDETEVRAACNHLNMKVMPELVHDLKEGEVGFPMDGQSLSRLLHKRGINVRYLGKIALLAEQQGLRLQALNALAVQEMVARAFKHVANRQLRHLPAPFVASCISHLLNCLLGSDLNQNPVAEVDDTLRSLYSDADLTFEKVTPEIIKSDIRSQVHLRYRYSLDEHWISSIKHLQMLREVALKLGLQLEAKEYIFTQGSGIAGDHHAPDTNGISSTAAVNGHPGPIVNGKKKKKAADHASPPSSVASGPPSPPITFSPDDVLNIAPIVKEASPRSTLAEEALEAGRISIMQNQKELGQELLLESLSLHEQIYGILHPEVARVYYQLSMLYYQLEEKNAAVELARKAVIVSERTLGIDCAETVLSYLNLGLFEHANGNTVVALAYVGHALELWKIIYGIKHPDSITTINNAAVMLQHLKHYHESRIWFEASLAISEEVSGKQSVNTATLLFQLAQALALDQDSKAAVNRMREAYNIFLAKLGASDRNTKEAETWLEQLTQNAVSIARHAKDLQARRLRRVQLTPRVTLTTRPQPQVGQSSADAASGMDPRNSIGLDSRSIDELMRFIEGGGDSTKRSTPKKRTTRSNPKRRVGGVVGAAA
ncbi:MAG: Intracellular distribution of mitochondria [Pleopsidium flavum]|nr:MAG: Intracellular distribution of mitochondria [Pleopsidium flavum]